MNLCIRGVLKVTVAIALVCAIAVCDNLARRACSSEEPDEVQLNSQKPAKASTGANPDVNRNDSQAVRLRVRVVDTAGRPVPQSRVSILVLANEREFETDRVLFDGKADLAVGADGALLTPALDFDKAYVLQVEAPGMLSGLSRWSRSPEKATVKLPDVVLRRLLTVSGTVVDRDNRPIAGATLIQSGDGPRRTEATSDFRGQFEIAGVPEGAAFLFAEKAGYQFHGQRVAAEQGLVRVVLERTDDPRRRMLKALPAPVLGLTRDERLDLAFQVLKPRLSHRLAQQPPVADFWLVRELAHANLAVALDYLDRLVATGISQPDRVQQITEIAAAIVVNDPHEALAIAQNIADPAERLGLLHELSRRIVFYAPRSPEFDEFQTDQLFSETAFAVRGLADPAWQAQMFGTVAETLASRGNLSEARLVLDEASAALEAVDPEVHPWQFGWMAAMRAMLNPEETSQRLAEIRKDEDSWRVTTGLLMARRRPQQAEELLATIDVVALLREQRAAHPGRPPLYCPACFAIAHICTLMAAIDPTRAERIAVRLFDSLGAFATPVERDGAAGPEKAGDDPLDLISDVEVALLKATTLARMAERVVATDRQRAREWLDSAISVLVAERNARYRDGWFYAPAAVMATLLPLAEQIDPALAHELFWRSLSLRTVPLIGDGRMQKAHDGSLASLAWLIARYDMNIARQLLAPLVANNRGEFVIWSPADNVQIRIDCDALLARAREFAVAPFDETTSNRERLRLEVAERLASMQNHIERDWLGFSYFELEVVREQLGFNFHHPRMEE